MDNTTKKSNDSIIKSQKENKEVVKNILNHMGAIVSISIVLISIILFIYNIGYCLFYRIPVSCLSLDVTNAIPIFLKSCSILGMSFYIIRAISAPDFCNRHFFKWQRVLFGMFFFFLALLVINSGSPLFTNSIEVLFLFPIGFECVSCVIGLLTDKKSAEHTNNESIINAFKCIILRKPKKYILLFFCIIVFLAYSIGCISAIKKLDYQVFTANKQQYVVIIDYSDKVLAQKSIIDKKVLKIDNSNYRYFDKNDIEFTYQRFKKVSIK